MEKTEMAKGIWLLVFILEAVQARGKDLLSHRWSVHLVTVSSTILVERFRGGNRYERILKYKV